MVPFLTIAMPFWGIYNVMNNEFILMGSQMNNYTWRDPQYNLPPAPFFSGKMGPAFNSFAIILFIPFLEYALFPGMKKLFGYEDTMLKRMFIGLIFASASVFVAGAVELLRKSSDPVVTWGLNIAQYAKGSDHSFHLQTSDNEDIIYNPFYNLLIPAKDWLGDSSELSLASVYSALYDISQNN